MKASSRNILFFDFLDSRNTGSAQALQHFFCENRDAIRLPGAWLDEFFASDKDNDHGTITSKILRFIKKSDSRCPIIICSDHRVTAYALSSLPKRRQQDLHLVVLDAHSDCQGSIASLKNYNVMSWIHERIKLRRMTLIGLRDQDENTAAVRKAFTEVLTMQQITETGIGQQLSHVLAMNDGGPIYLSIDLDVVDPLAMPAVGAHISGGLLPREVMYIARSLSPFVTLADVVEFDSSKAAVEHFSLVADIATQVWWAS